MGNQLSPLMFGDIKTQSLIGWVDILDVVWAPKDGEAFSYSFGTGYCADDLEQWCEDSDSDYCPNNPDCSSISPWLCDNFPYNAHCKLHCGYCEGPGDYNLYGHDYVDVNGMEYTPIYYTHKNYNWFDGGWGKGKRDDIDRILKRAPYVEGAIRLTFVNGQYWPNTEYFFKVVANFAHTSSSLWSPSSWPEDSDAGPRVNLFNQVFTWYSGVADGWADGGYDGVNGWTETYEVFDQEMRSFAESAAPYCNKTRFTWCDFRLVVRSFARSFVEPTS